MDGGGFLIEALDIRRKVLDQVPGAKITDARAKLELACEQNNKYALYLKARAICFGGFGYERECETLYMPVYKIAKMLGCCTWIEVADRFAIGLDDEFTMHMHMWKKREQERMTGIMTTIKEYNKDRLLLYTSAQNGNSHCACLLYRVFANFYTVYERISFCIIARAEIFNSSRDFWRKSSSLYKVSPAEENTLLLHAEDTFVTVNRNCKKSVLAWLSTKVLMKDMMKYIGQIIWNN